MELDGEGKVSRRLAAALLAALTLMACGGGTPTGPGSEGSFEYLFGAKFEPPAGRLLFGMGQWKDYNVKLLDALPDSLRPAAELIFITLGDTPRGWRPEAVAAALAAADSAGVIPSVDIALRGLKLPQSVIDTLDDPHYGIDDDIVTGSTYDDRIQDLIDAVGSYGGPVIVRIGGEFNGAWNGYHPLSYPKAFRKIVQMFRASGVDNAAFVWCYEPAAAGDFADRDAGGDYLWYPGADVIDWYSIDWFVPTDFSGPLEGERAGGLTANGRTQEFLHMAVTDQKPVMIAESSPSRYDLSSPSEADAAWAEWFEPYFQVLAEHPEIEWFHFISYDWTEAGDYAASGWKNNDLTADPTLLQRLENELGSEKYLFADEIGSLRSATGG